MRVIEVVIDGFKSYAVRTVISGWDESFNSITGLNGSGKSNILDSICFVLGITNMSTVRAQNLQDLIYKRGQAGVTKASVTIVFDNRDKKKSPIGFEEYPQISVTRQIMLGGTSKYLINGHRAQQQTVQNLFQSVQLNINNPNFLIMQGKITKVLNMKSLEILAMIEEAAGTRMFEDRRDRAFKTMAKKEMKVQEITELLRDEIEPKLEKLRTEKRAFLDFQQTQNDLERLTRLVVAHDYIKSNQKLNQSQSDLEQKKLEMCKLEADSLKLKSEIEYLTEDVKRVRSLREKEVKRGGMAQALEEKVKNFSHELVRLTTVVDLKESSISEERERKAIILRNIAELKSFLEQKTYIYDEIQMQYDRANQELQKQSQEVEVKEELLQTLQTGVASKEGQESGYQGQLQDARNRVSAASTEQEQLKLKITHLETRIEEESPRAIKAKDQNKELLNGLQSLRVEAQTLENQLKTLGFIPGQENDMYKQETELQNEIWELKGQIDSLKRKVINIEFNYDDPTPNFNRHKVKGLVAQLFTLDKKRLDTATALEICAGGRLYNVVVDTETTGTQILQKGKLRKRITIIPLNKITAIKASSEKIDTALQICPGKVDLALSLIGYDEEVSAAMDYVFGNTLICADAATAKRITFDPVIRMKSITLEGDSYDPSGTLSGGSSANSNGVLITLQKLNELNKTLEHKEDSLRVLQATIASEKQKLNQIKKIKQELDLKSHEIKLCGEQIENNSSTSIIQVVENMKLNVSQMKDDLKEAKKRQEQANLDVKRIEKDIVDFHSNKDGKLIELQTSLDLLRKSLTSNLRNFKDLQKKLQEARLDLEQAGSDLSTTQDQLHDIEQILLTQDKEIHILDEKKKEIQKKHDNAHALLLEEHAKLTGFDEELNSLEQISRSKSAKIVEGSLEIQKIGHQIEKSCKEIQAAKQAITSMEKEHGWIIDEKGSFGLAGSLYDFNGQNISECKSSLRNLSERFQGMKKKINPKVMNMIDSVEKKEVSLKNMMKTVIRDKKKIEETIITLDEYKKKALLETWTKVNKDFGQIFAELLPGSFAKLDPPEGKTINDGLEFKVSLGNVWKQSLTEFSGGQRSLIALSLIMALLQFKPAPMYILDEVDAALDLSHTQNIGRLIKTRFKGSQFIVVSLKDGMFQNANRIFRTRFSEGTSVVQALTVGNSLALVKEFITIDYDQKN
ncbi:Structural maintenance of chromosomes protein 2 [Erysiphe necator]|nr:Structural maintenance of chromosomes protein 2 [Erysiphe necator]